MSQSTHVEMDATSSLETVLQGAAGLLDELKDRPRALRLRVGEVSLEVEWPDRQAPDDQPAPGTPAGPTSAPAADDGTAYVRAPVVGVFYRAPEPGAKPFADVGDAVAPGQQLGIVEAMKLMIPVAADHPGRITEILKKNGEPVEFGEPLFALGPVDSPGSPDDEGARI